MSVTFEQLGKILPMILKGENTNGILIRGKHGIGKSQIIKQYAKKIGLEIVERRASQMTEGDLLGLPKLVGNVTTWNPPQWLYQACNEPVCLLIDEIDRATNEVRQGFFELLDSRQIAGWKLHSDTKIFASINGDKGNYQTNSMDSAEVDRWVVFDADPSVKDWLDWAVNNDINEVIINFIQSNHNHLEHTGDQEPSKVYPSRRSWHRFSDICNMNNLITKDSDLGSGLLYQIAEAYVGLEAAIAFIDFVRNYSFQVSPEDILNGDNKIIKKLKDSDINFHLAMSEKFLTQGWYEKGKMSQENIVNFAKYWNILPSEIAVKAFKDLSQVSLKDNDKQLLKDFYYKQPKIREKMVQYLTGEEKEEISPKSEV